MMRRLVALSLQALPALLFGAGLAGATQPPSPCALRFEGYGGMSVIDPQSESTSNNANAGGTGSAACLFDYFHVQGDVFGDYNDLDKIFGAHTDNFTNVGAGAHFGLADPKVGAVEINGAYNREMIDESGPSGNLWRIGMEGEYYIDPATIGVSAGYMNNHLSSNSNINNAFRVTKGEGYWARGMLRYYVTEDIKLEGLGGVGTIDGDTIPQARVLAEYRPHSWPVGFFIRGEGAWDNSVDQYFATGGIRLYLFDEPATLRETDRRYFREACTQFLVGVRTC
jgi:hypothetical protein